MPSFRDCPRAVARFLMVSLLFLMIVSSGLTVFIALRQQWHDGPYRISSITHRMPELDYGLLWSAGKMASDGRAIELYDGPKFLAFREEIFGNGLFRLDWIYPPPMILVAMIVAHFSLLGGYFVWVIFICVASIFILRAAGLSWPVVLLGLYGPPTWRAMMSGQYAPLAASFVLAGLLRAREAPIQSGIQLSLATLKPHLGILVPIVWLAQLRWAAFSTATIGTLGLAAGSTLLLGREIWVVFLSGGSAATRALLEPVSPEGYWGGAASVFWMMRSFGLSLSMSYWAQFLTAVAAMAVAWAAARRGSEIAAAAVAACAMSLVSPYLYYSDLVGYSVVVAMIAERRRYCFFSIFLWLCPGVSTLFAFFTGKQVLPVFVVIAGIIAWRQFRHSAPVGQAHKHGASLLKNVEIITETTVTPRIANEQTSFSPASVRKSNG